MFDFVTLPGGLRLAGERLTHVRSCTVGVWVRVGSMNELPEENGLSHFIEHMVFKGTQNRSARDIAEEMDPRRRPAQRLHQQGMHLLLRQGDRRRASPGRGYSLRPRASPRV